MEQLKNMQGGDCESKTWTPSWPHGCLRLRTLVFHLDACLTEGSYFFWTKHQRTRPRCQHTVICKHVPKGVGPPPSGTGTQGAWCLLAVNLASQLRETMVRPMTYARARVSAPPSPQWGLDLKQPWKSGECKYYLPGNTIHIFTYASGSPVVSLRH